MAKLYDIAVVTGEYTDGQGQTKKRYQNVGAVMEGKEGGQFIVLNSWFNPAGVPRKDGSESILLSCFAPKGHDDKPQQSSQQRKSAPEKNDAFDDTDIPF